MDSRISNGNSGNLAGRARNRLILPFEEPALLRFGQPGKGQAVYRPLTALHLHVLQTRAPGNT